VHVCGQCGVPVFGLGLEDFSDRMDATLSILLTAGALPRRVCVSCLVCCWIERMFGIFNSMDHVRKFLLLMFALHLLR
jgi:hypothetical protein